MARVYLGGKEADQLLRLNGHSAAGLLVYKHLKWSTRVLSMRLFAEEVMPAFV